jgi:hypothetical protein
MFLRDKLMMRFEGEVEPRTEVPATCLQRVVRLAFRVMNVDAVDECGMHDPLRSLPLSDH